MFGKKKKRENPEINASSMADIAFLLLIFFLVATTIINEKGVDFILPKKKEDEQEIVPQKERNVFKVLINSQDKMLVNGEPMDVYEIRAKAKEFISNNGRKPKLSESPQKAIVSYKTDRGTSYQTYLDVLDELKGAYHELRAENLGIEVETYLKLDKNDKGDAKLLEKAKEAYPLNLSEAEPTDIGQY